MATKQIVLSGRPTGKQVLEDFQTNDFELAEIRDKEILLEAMFFSVDPYMRGRMNAAKSYVPPFEIGKPITGGVIAKVIKSNALNFKENDIVKLLGLFQGKNIGKMIVEA